MKLREETASDLTVEQTFAAHCEQSVREQACQQSGALSWDVTITRQGETARIHVNRVMPSNVPDFVKRFIGETVAIQQIEDWRAPDALGVRTADVTLNIRGQPASMTAIAKLTPHGAGSVEVIEGDVRVAVPMLGKKLEPEIVKVIRSGIRVEQRVVVEWGHAQR